MMGNIMNCIQSLGIEVLHIPPCKRARRLVLITSLIYANRDCSIGAVDEREEMEAQNVFARDRLSFTREHMFDGYFSWCPE
jgi:hypothetical protein